jgi:hypothetical protein
MLAGTIVNTKLEHYEVTIGDQTIELGGTVTAFSGSFTGDGSALTGIASDLDTSGNTGTGNINLKTQGLAVTGSGAISTAAANQGIEVSVATTSGSILGVASFNDDNFSVATGAVTLANDVAIVQDLTVGRNLTVQGTASFQHTTNLDITDRFIRMASGSTSAGDGGIAIQQTGTTDSEGFGWDSAVKRWGVTGSFDASQNLMVPDAFMATVIEGSTSNPTSEVVAKYTKKGNIFAAADESIWICS